jgi:hypothetical protein
MRIVLLISTIVLFAVPCFAGSLDLNYQAAYSPPGGDIVVGNKIGRYVIDTELQYSDSWYRLSANLRAYGVADWMSVEQRGHGWDKFSSDYAWQADEWRFAATYRAEIGKDDLYLFAEHYLPIDRHTKWKGHGQSTEYYYLVGVGGTLNLWSSK